MYSTDNYTYGNANWGDLLTAYKGTAISYDTIGNPLSYYNGYTFTWAKGRQLATATNGTNTLSFTYNADGIRTSKTVNGVKHTYLLSGSTIMAEYWQQSGVQHVLIYLYDNTNSPVGMMYRTNAYAADTYDYFLFEKNLQGDIVAVYNASGTKLLSYTYDAWGNCTVTGSTTTGAQYNPFRYRGYYYDSEIELYYLNSRYYDANTGRFINADGYIYAGRGILGYNAFAYCHNNPIMYIDSTGTSPFVVLLVVAALVGMLTSCGPQTVPTGVLLDNEYTEENGYYSYANYDDAIIHGIQSVYDEGLANQFDVEYGCVIYQFNDDNPYGERTDLYWVAPADHGTINQWDPNIANIPDGATIIAAIHLHVDGNDRQDNGGFSGEDMAGFGSDRFRRIDQYVIVLGRVIPQFNGEYIAYKYNYAIKKGEKYHAK